tara:strand:- start:16512 stop:16751 length:240 start_codon:yes stop_codon:yes gene_type:complete
MKKVTKEMVKNWVGNDKNKAIHILKEIANSYNDKTPWTPSILNKDINQTWDNNSVTLLNGKKTVTITSINEEIANEWRG